MQPDEYGDSDVAARCHWIARVCALAVAALGMVVLTGWTFDVAALKSHLPGNAGMKPSTAFGLVATGTALWADLRWRLVPRWRIVPAVLAAVVAMLGALTLTEYLLQADLGTATFFVGGFGEGSGSPAAVCMAGTTAVGLMLTGVALLLIDGRNGWIVFQVAAIAGNLIGVLALLGYAYGISPLYATRSYSTISVESALGLVVINVGVLCVGPRRGLVALLVSNTTGGVMARRLMPLALLAPFLIGWFHIQGEHRGVFGAENGVALITFVYVLLFSAFIWRTADQLRSNDLRRRAADAARERLQAQLGAIIDTAMDAIVTVDDARRVVRFNAAAERMFGRRSAEVLGGPLDLLLPLHDRDQYLRAFEIAGTTDAHVGQLRTVTGLRADGSEFPIEGSISQSRADGGRFFTVIMRDITERKQAEEVLRKSQEQLKTFIEYAPISIAMFDRRMDYLATSRRWLEEFGRGRANLIGCNHYEVIPDMPEGWRQVYEQALAGSKVKNEEDRWLLADGRTLWLRWAALPWIDRRGNIGGIMISTEDITDQKEARQRLSDSEGRLAGVVNSAMDAVISIDEEQRIRLFNPAAAQIFGLRPEEAIGEPVARLIPPRLRGAHDGHVRTFALTGTTSRRMGALGEITGVRANGEEFPIEASISQTMVGGARLLTVILRDVTERWQAERELRELRNEMDQMLALHVAGQTAAAIAHELNQPLSAVASYSEAALAMLRSGNFAPERLVRALEGSNQQAQRAGAVMHELIGFLHKGETPTEDVDLNDAVRRALVIIESDGYGGFKSVLELAPELRRVRANRLQIEKVLSNLLRNSVEAMRAAGVATQAIRIRVSTAASGDRAQVDVSDSGPGLDAAASRRVFEPFFTTKPRGIGMGLAVSRSLIEAHGGRLWVEPGDGSGATFRFTLPFAPG
jgi:PAS domain S-box-containing protein